MKKSENFQSSEVFKAAGSSSFMTIDVCSVSIDKIMLSFFKYNEANEKGNRIEKKAEVYLSPLDALILSRKILAGEILNHTRKSIDKARSEGRKYAEPVYMNIGGSKNLCRVFQIGPSAASMDINKSTQSLFNLKAMTGKAKINTKGGISPDFKFNEAETQINLAVNFETLLSMGFVLEEVAKMYLQHDVKVKIDRELQKAYLKARDVS